MMHLLSPSKDLTHFENDRGRFFGKLLASGQDVPLSIDALVYFGVLQEALAPSQFSEAIDNDPWKLRQKTLLE